MDSTRRLYREDMDRLWGPTDLDPTPPLGTLPRQTQPINRLKPDLAVETSRHASETAESPASGPEVGACYYGA